MSVCDPSSIIFVRYSDKFMHSILVIKYKVGGIGRKHLSSHRCHNIFKAAPIVIFRRSNNLTNFLVRAKLRNPSQNNTPPLPEVFFNAAVIVLRAPTYPTDIPLTLSIPQAKHYSPHYLQLEKPCLHDSSQTLSQTSI